MLCCEYIIFAFQEKSFSLNGRLRSSHAWYRSRSQWLCITGAKIHDSKTEGKELLKKLLNYNSLSLSRYSEVRRETAWELWDSSGRSKLQLHVGGGLEEAYDSELQFPLGCHATATRQEHHQVNQVTSQVGLSKIFVYLKPWAFPIKQGRSWVSLPTHNKRGEHQARKNNLCSPRTWRRSRLNG